MADKRSKAKPSAVEQFFKPTQWEDDDWGNIELPGLSDEELHGKNWDKVTRGKQISERRDPKQWHEKNTARFDDPEWMKQNKEKFQKRWSDPEYKKERIESMLNSSNFQQGVKRAIKKRMANKQWQKNIADARRKQAQDPHIRNKTIKGAQKYWNSEEGKKQRTRTGNKNASNPEFARRVMLGRGVLPFYTPWGLYYNANLASDESRDKHTEYVSPGKIRKMLKQGETGYEFTNWQVYDNYYGITDLPQSKEEC